MERVRRSVRSVLKPRRIGISVFWGAISLGLIFPVSGAAQRMVLKRQAECPMGYVDTAKGTCSTLGLQSYTLRPLEGNACPDGWMNVGGGYCRKN